ncbi:MAG TPA: hypothetical protein VFZ52_25580 [Chryseolinea sp.]
MKIKSIVYAFAVLTPIISNSEELPTEIPLWSNGVPGFESRRNKPTEAKNWWVKNIHNPSNIVYPAPRDKATGTGVVVCPDGPGPCF